MIVAPIIKRPLGYSKNVDNSKIGSNRSSVPTVCPYDSFSLDNFYNSCFQMDYTVQEVSEMIEEGTLHVNKLRPKDITIKKNLDIYNVFDVIYTDDRKLLPYFYYCQRCEILLKADKGTAPLHRHECFENYIIDKKEKMEEEASAEAKANAPIEMKKPQSHHNKMALKLPKSAKTATVDR